MGGVNAGWPIATQEFPAPGNLSPEIHWSRLAVVFATRFSFLFWNNLMFWHRTQVQRFTPPVSRALSLSLSRHALGRSVGWLLTGVAVGFFCFSHGVGTTAAQESETSLKSQLDKMSEQAKQRFPAEMLKTMEDAIDEVRESDLV